jgi:3'-phosphoadenosine 5'-phosphosulfate sulfotransferase (PAPS reductase)/FAD synthetase
MGITNADLELKWPYGAPLLQKIATISDTIFMAFSCGKDSIATFLYLRDQNIFKKIIPYYLYSIPGLKFVDRSLEYYELFFETKIYRLPHPSLYRWINNCVFQPPQNRKVIETYDLPVFEYKFLIDEFQKDLNLKNTWTANGVRAVDSIMRRLSLSKNGPINQKNKTFMPIWNWKKQQVFDFISSHKCELPVDYKLFGRSFDGIDYRFIKPIKDNFPDDYQRILDFFPLAELEIKRREFYQEHTDAIL